MNRLFHYLRYDWPLHVVMLLTSWLPNNTIFFFFFLALCRPFFAACGSNLRLGRNITFYDARSIRLGKNVYIAYGGVFLGDGEIVIEDEVMIGPYVVVAAANHTLKDGSFRFGEIKCSPVKIGAGSWIGAHTPIAGGAQIGKGCLIASNAAVASGRIPDGHLAGGVPARVIRKLSEDPGVKG